MSNTLANFCNFHFVVTNFPIEITKPIVFYQLVLIESIESLIVSEEKSDDTHSKHHHILMKFKSRISPELATNFINEVYHTEENPHTSITLRTSEDTKTSNRWDSLVKYVTKSDENPLFKNVDVGLFK